MCGHLVVGGPSFSWNSGQPEWLSSTQMVDSLRHPVKRHMHWQAKERCTSQSLTLSALFRESVYLNRRGENVDLKYKNVVSGIHSFFKVKSRFDLGSVMEFNKPS